uniref:Uncharacterized protein n=1 Tax=Alexandrium catenella TaxID=2925 RepID=A0A7S1S4I1_ALECA
MAAPARLLFAALTVLSLLVDAEASFGRAVKRYTSYCLVCCFLVTSFICGLLVLGFMVQKSMVTDDEEGDWPTPQAPSANSTQASLSDPQLTTTTPVQRRLLRLARDIATEAVVVATTTSPPAALAAVANSTASLVALAALG